MTIASRKNPFITHLRKLGASREYRYETREFLCDGEKLLQEAVASGAEITGIVTSGAGFEPAGDAPCYRVPPELVDYISPLKNPQGIVFSCQMPQCDPITPDGRYVILDGIQDPGNVGTIIRTANAFGFEGVLLTGGCADPYNPKTVRSAMGAVFWQKVMEISPPGLLAMKKAGMKICGGALRADSRDVRDTAPPGAAIAIGSEGRGLSDEMLDLCDGFVKIPMSPRSESLNAAVAAAIIMWEAIR